MTQKNLHRWLVRQLDPSVFASNSRTVFQSLDRFAFGPGPDGMSVSLVYMPSGDLQCGTLSANHDTPGRENRVSLPSDVAWPLFFALPFRIYRERYLHDDTWTVDQYTERLRGLVVISSLVDCPPSWASDAVALSPQVTERTLAELSFDLPSSSDTPPSPQLSRLLDRLASLPKRVVVTGGPCSGKSTAIRRLQADLPGLLHVVPEVATIVIGQVKAPPFPTDEAADNRRFNRNMCELQRRLEELGLQRATCDGRRAVIMDRGTLDNGAYVSGGVPGLASACQTPTETEFSRYDAVIYIEMPSQEIYKRFAADNPARFEPFDAARELGQKVLNCWRGHTNLIVVPDAPTWDEKYARIREAVEKIIN